MTRVQVSPVGMLKRGFHTLGVRLHAVTGMEYAKSELVNTGLKERDKVGVTGILTKFDDASASL